VLLQQPLLLQLVALGDGSALQRQAGILSALAAVAHAWSLQPDGRCLSHASPAPAAG
jgi:hypothetical protein